MGLVSLSFVSIFSPSGLAHECPGPRPCAINTRFERGKKLPSLSPSHFRSRATGPSPRSPLRKVIEQALVDAKKPLQCGGADLRFPQ